MKKLLLFVLIILYVAKIKAQDYSKIDSLKRVLTTLPALNGTEGDTLRKKTYLDIGQLFINTIPDSAKFWFALIADSVFSEINMEYHPRICIIDANALRCLGMIYCNQGDYSKATEYTEKSNAIFNGIGDKGGISKCLNNLGLIYMEQGDYPKSMIYLEKSLKIREECGDKSGISYCFVNLGIVVHHQGNYLKAIEYFEKALKINLEIEDKYLISVCLMNLGYEYYCKPEYLKAIEYYERSLDINEKIGRKKGIASCMTGLGNIYYELGDYPKSIEYYEKSQKISEEIGDKRGTSYCLMNIGDIYYFNGDYQNAIKFYQKSLKMEEELGIYANLATNYPILANAYLKDNKYTEAASLYLKTARMNRKLLNDNFGILSEKEKGEFFETIRIFFNTLNEFGSITKSDSILTQCFDNELLLKGLLLNSSSSMMFEVSNSKDTSLTNSYWKLKQLRNNISELQSTPLDERWDNLDSIENLANEEERKLVKLSKDFANIQKQFNYKWQDVQKNLNSKDIAIEFIRINYTLNRAVGVKTDSIGYAALILRKNDRNPQIISLCSEAALLKMTGDLSWSDPSLLKMIYKTDSKKGLRLYDFIWKPLEQYMTGIDNIYYAPTGILNQISFVAIPTPEHKLLSDKYKLNLVSSTRVLIENGGKEKIKLEDAVFYGGIRYDSDSIYIKSLAQNNKLDEVQLRFEFKQSDYAKKEVKNWDYLPGTELEATKISSLLKKKKIKTTYYTAYDGLEERFKVNTTSPSIIHIATHGFSFPTPVKGQEYTLFENSFVHNLNPLFRSGLLLAGANRTWSGAKPIEGIEDGVLTAYEVSNLNLSNTKLVVLSACETGLGDLKGIEGVYGLQRAFKMAGVKFIVMSLWQVPDAQTAELMEYFYKELLSCKDVRKAFGIAQDKMKLKYEPYYWAGFVLME